MAKEAYCCAKRDLLLCQKRPVYQAKRPTHVQKRPVYLAGKILLVCKKGPAYMTHITSAARGANVSNDYSLMTVP